MLIELTTLPRPHFSGLPGPFTSITGTHLPHSHLKYFSSLFVCLLCNQVLYDPNQLALCSRINLLAFISSCLCACNGPYAVHVFISICLWMHTAPLSLHIHFTTCWICLQPSHPGAVCRSVFWRKVTFPLPASLYCWRILWWESNPSHFNIQHSTSMFIFHFSYFSGIFSSLKYFHLKIFICLDVVGLHCVMWGFFVLVHTLVVVCRLSCPKACKSLVPWPEIEPTSPGLQSGLLTTQPWEVPVFPFFTTPCLSW